jgi:hypothetical protein
VVAVAVKQSGSVLQHAKVMYVGSRGTSSAFKIDSFFLETPLGFSVQSLGPPIPLIQGGKFNSFSHAVRRFNLLWQSGTLI